MRFPVAVIFTMSIMVLGLVLLLLDVVMIPGFLVIIAISFVPIALTALLFKKVGVVLDGTSIRIRGPFVTLDIPVSEIDSIHTLESFKPGIRTFGFSGIHMKCGDFTNKTLGNVICVFDDRIPLILMLVSNKKKVLINTRDLSVTRDLLDRLCTMTGKTVSDGPYIPSESEIEQATRTTKIVAVVCASLLIISGITVGIFSFAGNVDVEVTESDITVDSMFMNVTLGFKEIISVDLVKDIDYGSRVVGVSNMKIKSGTFENGEFGKYHLAVYKDVSEAIVIRTVDETYVINQSDSGSTSELYRSILWMV